MVAGDEGPTNGCRSLATIPWIKLSYNPNLTLEQSAVFQNVAFSCVQERENRIAVFKGFNKWFPFYISASFQKMRTKCIVMERQNGKYWADEINFLINSKGSYSFAWKILQDHLECDNKCKNSGNFTCPDLEVSEQIMANFAQGGNPAQCQKAEDFLCDPWITVQLPFQPALFHQWLVAFIAEYTKIWVEISELYYLPYDDQFEQDTADFMGLLDRASEFIKRGFKFLQECTDMTNREAKFEFPNLNSALHFLHVGFKENLLLVIRSHKKRVWADPKVPPFSKEDKEFGDWHLELNNIYSLNFWRNATTNSKIFHDSEIDVAMYEEEATEENVNMDDLLESLQAHCSNQLETDDQLKEFLKNDETFMQALLDLRKNETISSLLRIREEEQGIIGMMLSISVNERMIVAANRAKRRLCEVTGIHPRMLLRTHYDDLPDEQISKDFIDDNLLKCDIEKYGLHAIEKFVDETKSLLHPMNSVYDDHKKKPDIDTILKFENRILRLVFTRILTLHNKIRGENGKILSYSDLGLHDWQFLQFILPCFVSTIRETILLNDEPDENIKKKKLIVQVVDFLIANYENIDADAVAIEAYENKTQALCIYKKFSSPILLLASFRTALHYLNDCFYGADRLSKQIRDNIQIYSLYVQLAFKGLPNHKVLQKNCTFNTLTYQFFEMLHHALLMVEFPVKCGVNLLNITSLINIPIDIISVICHVGLYPNFKPEKEADLSLSSNLVLSLVKFSLNQAGNKDDLKSTHRLKKRLKNAGKSFVDVAKEEVGRLGPPQQLGLALYLALKLVPAKPFALITKQESFSSVTETIFNSYLTHGKSRKFISRLFFRVDDKLKVNIKVALETAPVLFYVAMNEVNKDNNRYKITSRIDSQIFPIKHCRYCGKLDAIVDRACDLCTRPDDSLRDVHFFCSDECKGKAMKEFHQQEHDDRMHS